MPNVQEDAPLTMGTPPNPDNNPTQGPPTQGIQAQQQQRSGPGLVRRPSEGPVPPHSQNQVVRSGPPRPARGNVAPNQNAQSQSAGVVRGIEGGAMAGFNAVKTGFADIFGATYAAGQTTRDAATGAKYVPLSQSEAFGIKASTAQNDISGAAAYILPGGAVLHGIGDVKEGPAARAFDVGVGVVAFIPGVGEAGGALKGVTGFVARAGVGAVISGVGTALRGGTPTQDLEAAGIGAVISAGAPYAFRAVGGIFEQAVYTTESHPIVDVASESVKVGPETMVGETTESGQVIPGTERAVSATEAGYSGRGGSSYSDIVTGTKNAPYAAQGAPDEAVANAATAQFVNQSRLDIASRFASEQTAVESSEGGVSYAKGLEVAPESFESTRVNRFTNFFGRGEAATEDLTFGKPTTGPSNSEYYSSSARGASSFEEGSDYRSGESIFNNRGPGSASVLEPSTGEPGAYETTGLKTAFNEGETQASVYGLPATDEAFVTSFRFKGNQASGPSPAPSTSMTKTVPGTSVGTTTTPGTINPPSWRPPPQRFQTPPGVTPYTVPTPPPTKSVTTTGIVPVYHQTPAPNQNQRQQVVTPPFQAPFLTAEQKNAWPPKTRTGTLPYLMSPFSDVGGSAAARNGYGFGLKKHNVNDLMGMSAVKTKRRK